MTATRPPRKLTIALLAQVVFCLALAPVVLARDAARQDPGSSGPSSKGGEKGNTVQAAFDASIVRPEEDSNGEQKRGRPRSVSGSRNSASRWLRDRAKTFIATGRGQTDLEDSVRPEASRAPSVGASGPEVPPLPSQFAHRSVGLDVPIPCGLDPFAAGEIHFLTSHLDAGNPASQPIGPPSI
jgi:hypothetical protein